MPRKCDFVPHARGRERCSCKESRRQGLEEAVHVEQETPAAASGDGRAARGDAVGCDEQLDQADRGLVG